MLNIRDTTYTINQKMRKESEIFSELSDLCLSPSYVHAIAYFCFRDNTIKYAADSITPDDVLQQFSTDGLVRTEISTLIGLACKGEINTALPTPDVMQSYIDKTDALLKEIHQSMLPSMEDIFDPDKLGDESFNPFKNGSALRRLFFIEGKPLIISSIETYRR
jgi:hypothetical protein